MLFDNILVELSVNRPCNPCWFEQVCKHQLPLMIGKLHKPDRIKQTSLISDMNHYGMSTIPLSMDQTWATCNSSSKHMKIKVSLPSTRS